MTANPARDGLRRIVCHESLCGKTRHRQTLLPDSRATEQKNRPAFTRRILRFQLMQKFEHCFFAFFWRTGEIHFGPAAHVFGQKRIQQMDSTQVAAKLSAPLD